LAGVAHFLATDDAVCGLEGDGTDQVVAEVLCNLERDLSRLFADRDRGLQCVVDVRNRVVRELDVDNRTVDACDAPGDRGRRLVSRSGGGHFRLSPDGLFARCEGVGAADDLRDLLRDLRLTRVVAQTGVV